MPNLADKRYPLSRYLQATRLGVGQCEHCGKWLRRGFMVLNGQVQTRKGVEAHQKAALNAAEWTAYLAKHELAIVCRSCSLIVSDKGPGYFDLLGFKHYLRHHLMAQESTVTEYVFRLRRLERVLAAALFSMPVFSLDDIREALDDKVSPSLLKNGLYALKHYERYIKHRVF